MHVELATSLNFFFHLPPTLAVASTAISPVNGIAHSVGAPVYYPRTTQPASLATAISSAANAAVPAHDQKDNAAQCANIELGQQDNSSEARITTRPVMIRLRRQQQSGYNEELLEISTKRTTITSWRGEHRSEAYLTRRTS